MITFVLGGARSGKSDIAERLALAGAGTGPVRYLATGWADPDDDDMAARIDRHRGRRADRFETVEAGADLVAALRTEPATPVLVDSIGTWVARHPDFVVPADDLVAALTARVATTVVVSDEVGLGVHPETATGRQFRDALGTLNQQIAAVAATSYLVVAGRVLVLGDPP